MGMYDTVKVPCPQCGEISDFQTKVGDCVLEEYELRNAPADVLLDVTRHPPNICKKCGTRFFVSVIITAAAVVV